MLLICFCLSLSIFLLSGTIKYSRLILGIYFHRPDSFHLRKRFKRVRSRFREKVDKEGVKKGDLE